MSGAEIFKKLLSFDLDYESFDWLANRGLSEFEILISVILTQNTNWQNVLKALANLKNIGIDTLEKLAKLSENDLAILIKPSGFYNVKARRLKDFCDKLLSNFKDLEDFKKNVSSQWLLNIKGLGQESVDGILNYLCSREILVIDNYSFKLAKFLGYELENYKDLQDFFSSGVESEQEKINKILNSKKTLKIESKMQNLYKNYELCELYQIFHALIVVFGKIAFKGQNLTPQGKNMIEKIKEY